MTILGLILGFAGAAVLLFFPPNVATVYTKDGYRVVQWQESERCPNFNRYHILSKLGPMLLTLGFALQLISELCPKD